MKALTENTKISISLAIVAFGAVGWLTKIYVTAENTARAVETVQFKQEKYSEDIAQIRADIAVIKKILKEEE